MSSQRRFAEEKVGVRSMLSAAWVAVLLLFAYGDIFGFFVPGRIDEVVGGEVAGMKITQPFLFAVSVYVAIAAVMVVVSLTLPPRICRWASVVLAALYIVSIVASAIGEDAYFLFLSTAECVLLLVIIRRAWMWPTEIRN